MIYQLVTIFIFYPYFYSHFSTLHSLHRVASCDSVTFGLFLFLNSFQLLCSVLLALLPTTFIPNMLIGSPLTVCVGGVCALSTQFYK